MRFSDYVRPRGLVVASAVVMLLFVAGAFPAGAGLILYYDMDDGSGVVALDSSPSGWHGALQAMDDADWVPGFDGGTALEFDGVDDHIKTGRSVFNFGIRGNFTAAAWVNLSSTAGDNTVFGVDNAAANSGLYLTIRDGKPHFGFLDNDTGSDVLLATGMWYHITWRFENGEQSMYVNGGMVASTGGHANFGGWEELKIGRWNTNRFFSGMIDDVAIWNTALPPIQVAFIGGGGSPLDIDQAKLQAVAGGPYTVGGLGDLPVSIDGSGSMSINTITLYEWDLTGDGNFTDATGVALPEMTRAEILAMGLDHGVHQIALKVTDDQDPANTSIGTTTLAVLRPREMLEDFEDGDLSDWYISCGMNRTRLRSTRNPDGTLGLITIGDENGPPLVDPNVQGTGPDPQTSMAWGPAFVILDDGGDVRFRITGGQHAWSTNPRNGPTGVALWDHGTGSVIPGTFVTRIGTGDFVDAAPISLAGLRGKTVSVVVMDRHSGGWGWTGIDSITAEIGALAPAAGAGAAIVHLEYGFDVAADFMGWTEDDLSPTTIDNFTVGNTFGTARYINPNAVGGVFPIDAGFLSSTSVAGGWDAPLGTLQSPNFTIQGDFIEFMIAGGANELVEAFELWTADGSELLRIATNDSNQNSFVYRQWNIRDLNGVQAHFRLRDDNPGGWGHLEIDQIRMVSLGSDLIAVAGGPYIMGNGDTLTIDAGGSLARGSATIAAYDWDIDGDGAYTDASGVTTGISSAHLIGTLGWEVGGEPHTIGLRITDSDGGTAFDSAVVTIADITAEANGPYIAKHDAPLTLSAAGSIPAQVLSGSITNYEWDLDDDGTYDLTGTTEDIDVTVAELIDTYGLAEGYDVLTITLRITDNQGKTSTDTTELTIPPGLVGYWTFDDGTADDLSGNGNHGTFVFGAATSPADVPPSLAGGQALDLTLGNKYVTIPNEDRFDLATGMTVAAWVKGWPGTWNPFVCKNGEENGWQIRRHGGDSTLDWTTRGHEPANGDLSGFSPAPSDGNWHHIAAPYDGTRKIIYVDGVLDVEQIPTGAGIRPSDDVVVFGARIRLGAAAGNFLEGKLDDISIWSYALPPSAIAALAAGATPEQALTGVKLGIGGPYAVIPGQTITLDGSANEPPFGSTITAFEWDLNGDGVADITTQSADVSYDEFVGVHGLTPSYTRHVITLKVTIDDGNTYLMGTTLYIEPIPDLANGLVAFWNFEDGSGNIATDATGNGHDGVLQAMSDASWVPGYTAGSTALDFDGVSSYVLTTSTAAALGIDGNKPKTVSGWIFLRDGLDGRSIFQVGQTGANGEMFCLRTIDNNSTVRWRAQFWGGGPDFDFNSPAVIGRWAHFVLMHDGTVGRAYFDGVEVGSEASTLNTNNNRPFEIGRYGGGGGTDKFNGMIDDLALWNRPLAPPEIALLAAGESPMDVGKAVTGGPYETGPGGSITLDASASTAAGDETIIEYAWDLNNDGVYGDAFGVQLIVDYDELADIYLMVLGPNTIGLRVTDTAGDSATGAGVVNILGGLVFTSSPDIIASTPTVVTIEINPAAPVGGMVISFGYDISELLVEPEQINVEEGASLASTTVTSDVTGGVILTANAPGYAQGSITLNVESVAGYPGDVNGDGCINVADLLTVRNNLGKMGSEIFPPEADVTGDDDIVNVADLLYVRNRLGEGPNCP